MNQLGPFFREFQNIKWILAHAGAVEIKKYVDVAQNYSNVYLETYFSRCPRGLIEKLVSEVPLHKTVWGSGQTFLCAPHQIGRVLFAKIDAGQKRSILGENSTRLFEG